MNISPLSVNGLNGINNRPVVAFPTQKIDDTAEQRQKQGSVATKDAALASNASAETLNQSHSKSVNQESVAEQNASVESASLEQKTEFDANDKDKLRADAEAKAVDDQAKAEEAKKAEAKADSEQIELPPDPMIDIVKNAKNLNGLMKEYSTWPEIDHAKVNELREKYLDEYIVTDSDKLAEAMLGFYKG